MNWFGGSVAEAVNEAKRNGKLFLVYIEGTDEMSKQMSASYDDPAVAQKLSTENIIALKLAANSVPYVQFSSIYPVLVIPSSYFIGVNGTPIEVITGSLLPADFSAKIDNVLEVFEKSAVIKKSNEAGPSSSESPAPSSSIKETVSETSSSSEIADETESKLTLQEKVERAKALLEVQKQSRELEEKEKEKREELERRSIGKAIQQAEQAKRDIEMKEWAKNRAKEKEEERLAREKVKAMIAQDRAERAAKYQMTKEAEQAERERQAKIREEQERAARSAAMNSNEARIQFRLPDGSFTTHSFSADSSLEEARRFVIEVPLTISIRELLQKNEETVLSEVRPPFSNFSLCTTFPRRHFTESNYSETLRDLQLAPSAVLLVLPAQAVASVNKNASFFSNLFWMLISPLTSIWRLIQSFFPGSSQEPNRPPSEVPTNVQQPSTSANRASDDGRQSATRRREPTFYKREGNVFRINNQSDEDENNTWNGNSTQQM